MQVFETVCLPVVNAALQGYNGTVFAYGQTGSGKTFTMAGGTESYSERGIIPRAVAHLYEQIVADNGMTTKVGTLILLLDSKHAFESSGLQPLPTICSGKGPMCSLMSAASFLPCTANVQTSPWTPHTTADWCVPLYQRATLVSI